MQDQRGLLQPLFQTSANLSGSEAPASFEAVPEPILTGVDLAIDGGELGGRPSTVIDISRIDEGGGWEVLREGAKPGAEIESLLGPAGTRD